MIYDEEDLTTFAGQDEGENLDPEEEKEEEKTEEEEPVE